ncbi:unnamed protein product [Anisakis simplex]|uniref:YhhN-like protein n=1 Tax=Anisakis simplex TaxID=6269 RepID=A0A0M3K6E8_ANISI|nr:unnamed protein product [Anisakis simplex]
MSISATPTQILAIYSGMAGFAYIETDQFRKAVPLLFVLPFLVLSALTLTLSMKSRQKFFTAASFLVSACALYVFTLNRRELALVCLMGSISHILYVMSFLPHVRRVWMSLGVVLGVYLTAILYHCFADLYVSIPTLVFASSLLLCVASSSVLAAGSVWYYESRGSHSVQAAALRFLGMLACLACSSVLILNQFGARFDRSNYMLTILHYVSQGLLFLANEETF